MRGRGPAAIAVLAAAVLGTRPAAQAQTRPAHPATPPVGGGVAGGLSTTGLSTSERVAQAVAQLHMAVCAAPLQKVADFLLEGQEADFSLQPLGPDTNRWPVVMTMESAHPALGRTRFSTIVAAPGPRCSGMYQQTIYWTQPCAELRRTVFSSFHGAKVMLKAVEVSEANAGLQLYLMPGGAGCMSVKKELFH